MDGSVTVNGEAGTNTFNSGGGSGGSVMITAYRIKGYGDVITNGGAASSGTSSSEYYG